MTQIPLIINENKRREENTFCVSMIETHGQSFIVKLCHFGDFVIKVIKVWNGLHKLAAECVSPNGPWIFYFIFPASRSYCESIICHSLEDAWCNNDPLCVVWWFSNGCHTFATTNLPTITYNVTLIFVSALQIKWPWITFYT